MKISEMLNPDFQGAIVALGNERLAMPVAYKLKKILKQINEELAHYNDLLVKLRQTYKPTDDNTVPEGFVKDYAELINMDVNVLKIALKDIENVCISTKDLMALEPILEEDI